jgi:hypothetical protein
MSTLTFQIDKERDIRNVWELCNLESPFLENEEKMQLNRVYKNWLGDRKFEGCKEEIKEYLNPLYSSGIINIFTEGVEKAWARINSEYFNRLEKLTQKPICSKNFVVYTTSVGRCSYNPKESSLMISLRRPLLQCLRTIGHELIHLQFHNSYWVEIENQIGTERTSDLNESLTILLNTDFGDLWFVEDQGYDSHKELRKFIYNEWKKEKDFDVLMKKCVEYLK